jgi:hypothetical protein
MFRSPVGRHQMLFGKLLEVLFAHRLHTFLIDKVTYGRVSGLFENILHAPIIFSSTS